MNKKITFFIILLFVNNCSLDTKSGFWTKSEKLTKETKIQTKKMFVEEKKLDKEFNPSIRINLKGNYLNNSFLNNLTNNNNLVNYKGPVKKISRFKFKKINHFTNLTPELFFTEDKSLVFYDNIGSILKFDLNSNLNWKSNIYKKSEKKLEPILSFAGNNKVIIVADNFGKYYSIDLKTGKLIWSKKNTDPFNSQIKIFGNTFFVVDYSNTLRCFSITDGSEIWKFKSTVPLIRSQQKTSIVLSKNLVIFINSLGELTALNNKSGDLIWQTPTQLNKISGNSFMRMNSDLVLDKNFLFFSNNDNDFFSIDLNSGLINWKQKINSSLRPTVINNLVFTITMEGYFVIIDSKSGNIIRITNIFDKIKKSKRNKIKPTGFIVSRDKIYLSLDNGRLLVINLSNGKTTEVVKIANSKISRPHIHNNNMYLIKSNAILKVN